MKVAEPDDYSIVSRFLSPSLFMNVTPSLMIALLLLLLFVSLSLFMKVAVRDDRAMHGQCTPKQQTSPVNSTDVSGSCQRRATCTPPREA